MEQKFILICVSGHMFKVSELLINKEPSFFVIDDVIEFTLSHNDSTVTFKIKLDEVGITDEEITVIAGENGEVIITDCRGIKTSLGWNSPGEYEINMIFKDDILSVGQTSVDKS